MPRRRSHTRSRAHSYPRGVLDVRSNGFGFVRTPEGEYFIPPAKMGPAYNGDLVEVSRLPKKDQSSDYADELRVSASSLPAARVVRVIERAQEEIIGRYEVAEPFGVVVPLDRRLRHDVFTRRADNPDIPHGSIVRAKITEFPARNQAACGQVVEVLGDESDSALAGDLIAAAHGLETAFSDGALAEARAASLDVAAALRDGYRDIRDRFVFTIDPVDARDFDDALSLEEVRGEGAARWRVGVHIADVSRYVPWNSSLDLDARRRATSVYLADRVIPMLPEELSADLCSLRPNEDRLAFTVDMTLDCNGAVLEADFYPSVICSNARLTYDQALDLVEREGEKRVAGIEPALVAPLEQRAKTLSLLAQKRAAASVKRGCIEFDSRETKAKLNAQGEVVGIEVREKTLSTSLVEEFMIAANEEVAKRLDQVFESAMYRVHEAPATDALAALVPVFGELPWFAQVNRFGFEAGNPLELQRCIELSRGRAEESLVSSMLLRSMKRAVYRPSCDGHYGLALKEYCHFTSPIRRYPDLVVHRLLKDALGFKTSGLKAQVKNLPWIAEHSSKMERIAEAASRESQEERIIEYLESYIGTEFEGVVSGVTRYGLYVRIEYGVEGLLPLGMLGAECFTLDAKRHRLEGQDTGRVFQLGRPLRVRLCGTDARARTIDLKPAFNE